MGRFVNTCFRTKANLALIVDFGPMGVNLWVYPWSPGTAGNKGSLKKSAKTIHPLQCSKNHSHYKDW